MTDDRVYSSNKQNGTAAAASAANNNRTPAATTHNPPTQFPASTKTHPYNPTRQSYRPTPTFDNRRKFRYRRCFCRTCFWATLLLIGILLLAAIASAAFYVLYHPRRPVFSVTSVKISTFNLTTTSSDETIHLTTKMNLTLAVRNPNKKAIFYFDPMSTAVQSQSVVISNGSYANSFTSPPDTISIVHAAVAMNSQLLDIDSANSLKSDLKMKNGLPIKIVIDTIMGVKLEKLKIKKIGIRVTCDGIKGLMPKNDKEAALANSSNAQCKVDLRIKILRWTF